MFDARHIWWFNAKTVTNGSISNVLVFSHFPTVMTNGHALLVCETEISIHSTEMSSVYTHTLGPNYNNNTRTMHTKIAALININKNVGMGGGGYRFCGGPGEQILSGGGQYPLVDSVRGDSFWGGQNPL